MKHRLFKWDEIKTMLRIYTTLKPIPIKRKSILMYAFQQNRQQILHLLQNNKERAKLIERKSSPWSNRDKIPIFGKKQKRGTKSKSLSLYLTKEEWVKRVSKFANDNIDNINLIPIVTFDGDKYCIDIIWIVQIEINVNIGISLNYRKCESLIAIGIYLDINDEHRLVPYKHDCQCLNDFKCNIDELRIGDSKQNQLKQQHRELQKKINKANKRIKTLENEQKQEMVIKSDLCESNMMHITIVAIDSSLENEEEKQEVISEEELTPNGIIDTNANNNNYTTSTILNDVNQRINSLGDLGQIDINAIVQINNICKLLESDLKRLQQQTNSQQQIINDLQIQITNFQHST